MNSIKIFFVLFFSFYSTSGEPESPRAQSEVKVESEVDSTVQLVFPIPESDSSISDSQEQQFQKMTIIQNLNYLDEIISNLDSEKQKLEDLWKSSATPSRLQSAAKSLWEKTTRQLGLLNRKKSDLVGALKNLSSSEEFFGPEGNNETTTVPQKEDETTTPRLSKAICQFFVFGTLFGVVVTITACSCFLQPKNQRTRISSTLNLNPSRIPEPFDYSKPCCLRADASGRFYASPIDGEEVPPLPTYEDALSLPQRITVETGTQTNQPRSSSSMFRQNPEPKPTESGNSENQRY